MGERWLPYSAAALASGAVALVLGALGLPSSPDGGTLLQTVQGQEGRWIMASAAFFFCSVGLVLGLPTFLYLVPRRGRRYGVLGVAVFATATMGMAAYGVLLAFFRALIVGGIVGDADLSVLGDDPGIRGFMIVFVGSFYIGEALLAVAIYRARTVPRWVPALLLLHVVMLPFSRVLPELSTVGVLMAAVAFMGVAVYANERANLVRAAA